MQFPNLKLAACPLCGSTGPLRESHIIPRFVFDWMLQSSATGFMRSGTMPNRSVKDGMKLRLLCDSCEGRLSTWEKTTAEQLFLPYHNNTGTRVRYESWLAKFCASVVWRVLFIHSRIDPLRDLSPTQNKKVNMALSTWKDLMFGSADNPGAFELHMLPADLLADAGGLKPQLPPNFNRYLTRAVEIDVAANTNSAFVYAKMCRLIVFGFIERPRFRRWHGTRVAMKQGIIEPKQFGLPAEFLEYLVARARNMAKLGTQISKQQKAKINSRMRADPDRAAQSDHFTAMMQDVVIFGSMAFESEDAE
jgi:hypothetical protein